LTEHPRWSGARRSELLYLSIYVKASVYGWKYVFFRTCMFVFPSITRYVDLRATPPGSEDWEASAGAWLLDLIPEYRLHPTVRLLMRMRRG
jgi:hypothetical protein